MNTERILETLAVSGLIDRKDTWTLDPIAGGLNSRVYRARRHGAEPTLTIRVRRPNDRSTAEIDALSDVSGCPGAPRLHLLTHNLLVLDFMPGEPQALMQLGERQLEVLAGHLACIHGIEYTAFTPWPEQELRRGTRADLFRFRIASLANYACYDDARSGAAHGALPQLLQRLSAAELTDPSWEIAEFSRLHGDLSRGNLLWNGDELGLIDWEFSRVGDPAEELAYLLTEQTGGVERLPQLSALYSAAGGAPDVARRMPAYGLFTAVDSVLWWVDYAATHGRDVRNEIDQRLGAAMDWLTHW